jgi:hypothetical protein
MPVVERAHQPRRWRGYRVTRTEFSAMVNEIKRVVEAELEGSSVVEISISDYERPFDSTDEFLENVEEREWIGLGEIDGEVRDPDKGGLRAAIGLSDSSGLGIRLRLTVADRRARNAIEPDVVAAIQKNVSQLEPEEEGRWYIWAWRILGLSAFVAFGTATVIEMIASNRYTPNFVQEDPHALKYALIWLFAALGVPSVCFALGSETKASIGAAFPAAEFLPDDGTTAWQTWKSTAKRRLLGARAVVYFLAAVATVATLFIAIDSSSSSSSHSTARHSSVKNKP